MSSFAALIATIQANIKTNGNEEITGAVLQDVLEAMVDALGTEAINNLETDLAAEIQNRQNADTTLSNNIGANYASINAINGKIPGEASISNKLADKAFVTGLTTALQNAVNAINANIENGYVYAGIATPSGTPVSGKVFYLARQAGTYTNFGGLTLTEGVNVLKYNGTAWSQEQLISIADIYKNPLIGYYECDTAGGTAAKTVAATGYVLPATGGSVKIKMANRNTVADATLNINSTGAKPLFYNGVRAGVGNTWDTNEIVEIFYDGTNYQANIIPLVDAVPTAGSHNLVKSGGVFDVIKPILFNQGIATTRAWVDFEVVGNSVNIAIQRLIIRKVNGGSTASESGFDHTYNETYTVSNQYCLFLNLDTKEISVGDISSTDFSGYILLAFNDSGAITRGLLAEQFLKIYCDGKYDEAQANIDGNLDLIRRQKGVIGLSPSIISGKAYKADTGVLTPFVALDCTTKIEVTPKTRFCYMNADYFTLACFDKDDVFIGDISVSSAASAAYTSKVFQLLEGTKYFSASFIKTEDPDNPGTYLPTVNYDNLRILCDWQDIETIICAGDFKPFIWEQKAFDSTRGGTITTFPLLDCTSLIKVPDGSVGCYVTCPSPFFEIACFDASLSFLGATKTTKLLDDTVYFSVSFLRADSVDYDDLRLGTHNTVNVVGIESRERKKYILYGDSITYFDNREKWDDPDYFIVGYPSYMRKVLNVDVVNRGVAGQTSKQITARLVSDNLSGAYAVTYMAGANDLNQSVPIGTLGTLDTNTYIGAVEVAVRHILTYLPQIKIYLLSPTFYNSENITPYAEAMQSVAEKYGIPILRWDLVSGFNELDSSYFQFDGIHPNNIGYARLADSLIPFLQNY